MAFKMKGYSAFTKTDPPKNRSLEKVELTDREKRIEQNKEFNEYAENKGWKPILDSVGVDNYTKFYSDKNNVNFLNQKQKEYFANKNKK